VDRASHQFLARAGLTEDAHARFTRGDALHLRHHFSHRFALPYDFMLAEPLPELPILALQTLQLESVVDRKQQFVGGNWFFQKVERTQPRCAHSHLDVRLPRHHDHGSGYSLLFQFLKQRETIFARHHNIRKNEIEFLGLGQFKSFPGVVAHRGFVSRQAKGTR
jgi:hypothetical protein